MTGYFTKINTLLVFFLLALQCSVLAQANFSATISPATIGKNETAELKLMVENASQVENITPPSLKDFLVVSGPIQSTSIENINGVTRQYIGISYILKPRSKGVFTINTATAKADGKTLSSKPVTLTVVNEATGNSGNYAPSPFAGISPFEEQERPSSSYKDYILKSGENIADKIGKNIFVKVDVTKTSCFVGEPIVVTYKLYTRLKSESSIIKNPSFNGFSVVDLMPPGNTYSTVEKLNGREYNVYTLRKSQLYPLQTGKVELESAEVENDIHFLKEEYADRGRNSYDDLFRQLTQATLPPDAMHDERVTLRSKPLFIEVKELPAENKPANFTGAVGEFNIDATVPSENISTDDASKLVISLSGAGNMNLVNIPEPAWPSGIVGFDPVAKEQLNKFTVPVSGIKTVEYPFTVANAGSYTIAPISFSYYDAKQNVYKTISTKPVVLTVKKGTNKPAMPKLVAKSGREHFSETIFTNRWMIIVPVILLVLIGLFIWTRKDKKSSAKKEKEHKDKEPVTETIAVPFITVSPLAATEEMLVQHDHKAFYETLNREIKLFLSHRLQIPVEIINKKRIAEEADKKGIPVHVCLQIQDLLDDVEWNLYTPFADTDKMQEAYKQADSIVHAINAMNL